MKHTHQFLAIKINTNDTQITNHCDDKDQQKKWSNNRLFVWAAQVKMWGKTWMLYIYFTINWQRELQIDNEEKRTGEKKTTERR